MLLRTTVHGLPWNDSKFDCIVLWYNIQVVDRIVFMDHGQIVEAGTPEHFFANPEQDRTRKFLSQIL